MCASVAEPKTSVEDPPQIKEKRRSQKQAGPVQPRPESKSPGKGTRAKGPTQEAAELAAPARKAPGSGSKQSGRASKEKRTSSAKNIACPKKAQFQKNR